MKWLHKFFIALFVYSTLANAALPEDAQLILKKLPQQTVTIEVVLGRAIQSSDSFQQALSQFPLTEIPRLQSRAVLEPQLYFKYGWLNDELETSNNFMPSNLKSQTYTLGVAKNFSTGTAFSAELIQGQSELDVATQSISYFESKAKLSLSQSLWRNFLGQSTRATLRSGELKNQARALEFGDNIQNWALQIMNLYYDSWLAKARVLAAEANTQRRLRLEKIMQIKKRRGTAEEPELLQVQSVLAGAKIQQREAEQLLRERWQGLVLMLKLPEHWLEINPKEIPLMLDQPLDQAQKLCTDYPSRIQKLKLPEKVEQKRLDAKAAEQSLRAAKSVAAPDLSLTAQYITNGIDPSNKQDAFSEMQDRSHPSTAIGLALTIPLAGYQEEINYRSALAEKNRAEAAAVEAVDQWRLEWLSLCHNLQRLNTSVADLTQTFNNQLRRSKLEEKRYEIGRATILAVVQAGDDATQAEVNLSLAEVGLRQVAWRIIKLGGELEGYMKKLEKLELKL